MLTGCSQAPPVIEEAPTPDTTGCKEARELSVTATMALLAEDWEKFVDLRSDYDLLALSASGEIKERLNAVVESIPNVLDAAIDGYSDYDRAETDLMRACTEFGAYGVKSIAETTN